MKTRKNITVSQDTHKKFKNYADEKGMKFDSFVLKLIEDSRKLEAIRGL